jgi:hypothetical protein
MMILSRKTVGALNPLWVAPASPTSAARFGIIGWILAFIGELGQDDYNAFL